MRVIARLCASKGAVIYYLNLLLNYGLLRYARNDAEKFKSLISNARNDAFIKFLIKFYKTCTTVLQFTFKFL